MKSPSRRILLILTSPATPRPLKSTWLLRTATVRNHGCAAFGSRSFVSLAFVGVSSGYVPPVEEAEHHSCWWTVTQLPSPSFFRSPAALDITHYVAGTVILDLREESSQQIAQHTTKRNSCRRRALQRLESSAQSHPQAVADDTAPEHPEGPRSSHHDPRMIPTGSVFYETISRNESFNETLQKTRSPTNTMNNNAKNTPRR